MICHIQILSQEHQITINCSFCEETNLAKGMQQILHG